MTSSFENLDGSIIEVRSPFARSWRPDSCRCILVIELNTLELNYAIHVCELHKTISDGRLVSEVLKHNNDINKSIPNPIDEDDEHTISRARRAEQQRIEALGAGETRADSATKDIIEADLRSKGR